MSWARTGFELQKKAREDQKAIEDAAKNVGKFASGGTAIGTLFGALGGGLLGTFVGAPRIGAGIGAAFGSKLGGETGRMVASKEDRNILKGEGGQTFYKTDADQLNRYITDDITKTSIGSGIQAFFTTEKDQYLPEDAQGKNLTTKKKREAILDNIGSQLENLIKNLNSKRRYGKESKVKELGDPLAMMNTSYDSKLEENPFDYNTMRG